GVKTGGERGVGGWNVFYGLPGCFKTSLRLRIERCAFALGEIGDLAHAAQARRGGVDDEFDLADLGVSLAAVVGPAVNFPEVRHFEAKRKLQRLIGDDDARASIGLSDRLRERIAGQV